MLRPRLGSSAGFCLEHKELIGWTYPDTVLAKKLLQLLVELLFFEQLTTQPTAVLIA